MNRYEAQFASRCPTTRRQIMYELRIEHESMLKVEDIVSGYYKFESGQHFHEDIADRLFEKFGGTQTLVALHDVVRITTTRP